MADAEIQVVQQRGWEVVRLSTELVEVDVLPGKGGDILGIRWKPGDVDILWTTPWGLRAKGAVPSGGDALTTFIENYPGGWQVIFPNGGPPVVEQGVELGFHGEACLVPWDWAPRAATDGAAIALSTSLVRSPFTLRRELRLVAGRLTVTESVRNVSGVRQEAMWSHHPAFGAPFLDGTCRVETGATRFVADDDYDTANGDLATGATSSWPNALGRDGGDIDLRHVPVPDACVDRLGYLLDFEEAWYSITNPGLGLTATVRWDRDVFPYAWLWFEGHGTAGFPWHQRAYVLAIEPSASYPGQGLAAVRDKTGAVLQLDPDEEREVTITFELSTR